MFVAFLKFLLVKNKPRQILPKLVFKFTKDCREKKGFPQAFQSQNVKKTCLVFCFSFVKNSPGGHNALNCKNSRGITYGFSSKPITPISQKPLFFGVLGTIPGFKTSHSFCKNIPILGPLKLKNGAKTRRIFSTAPKHSNIPKNHFGGFLVFKNF